MDIDLLSSIGMNSSEAIIAIVIPAVVGLVTLIISLVVFYLIVKRAVYAGFKKFYREALENEADQAQGPQG